MFAFKRSRMFASHVEEFGIDVIPYIFNVILTGVNITLMTHVSDPLNHPSLTVTAKTS